MKREKGDRSAEESEPMSPVEVRGFTLELPEGLCYSAASVQLGKEPKNCQSKCTLEALTEPRSSKGEASNTLSLVQSEAKAKTR